MYACRENQSWYQRAVTITSGSTSFIFLPSPPFQREHQVPFRKQSGNVLLHVRGDLKESQRLVFVILRYTFTLSPHQVSHTIWLSYTYQSSRGSLISAVSLLTSLARSSPLETSPCQTSIILLLFCLPLQPPNPSLLYLGFLTFVHGFLVPRTINGGFPASHIRMLWLS